ncbi:MAG TPA: RtcB family protein [Candidatus Woesearchaeota archaeon]|nr:RtcB family protein [Candidatus Woesearchaeota archaeon]
MSDQKIIPKKITNYLFEIPRTGRMKVPVRIYASEKLLKRLSEDNSLQQGVNVACLPGIYKASIMLPDAHQGYGFSIGGVAALDTEKGCISPGGIGFDINCGVRLLATPLRKEDVLPRIKELLNSLFRNVPSGVGSESFIRLSDSELDSVLNKGAEWAVEHGYGFKEDLKRCEEGGRMREADASKVSNKAKARGRKQLGTLGAGNHFLEVQFVEKIYDKRIAQAFGIREEGQIVIMIHCGSRGLGHQVCSDYLRRMEEADPELMRSLPEKDLIYARAGTQLAKDYFAAMAASANFAWANRHIIAHQVRKSFREVFGVEPEQVRAVYDVAHNIAKIEEHEIDGVKRKVFVHRKGATRSLPAGHPNVPEVYKGVGQPVLIPGSMGTASYLLVGTEQALKETFGSTAHGAGRVMSRAKAIKSFRGEQVKKELEQHHIYVKAASWKGICEEAPAVYKDIDEVVKVSHEAGIGNLVAKLKPIGVIKG